MNLLGTLRELIEFNLANFFNTDWSAVQFKQAGFAIWAAILLGAAFLLKILWRYFHPEHEKSFYEHSGHYFKQRDKPGFWYKILGFIPIMFVVLASGLLLIAIADPYVLSSHQNKSTQSREIIYLEDVSASMGFKFKNQQISRAEIIRDFILKLIAERKDKNDRAAFIIYATNPYRVADFTTDVKGFLFNVDDGPLVIADPATPTIEMYKGIFIVNDFMPELFGGESDLFLGLGTVIKLFDEKGDPKITEEAKKNPSIKRRSVIIATDGASDRDPETKFKELKKRGITPYLVFIDPDKESEKKIHGENSPQLKLPEQLLKQVKQYGGEYFIATNRSSLDQIRQRLDRLHAAVVEVKNYTTEQHIYRLPLVASFLLYTLAILARVIFLKFHRVV
ncbi:MAG: VWA domain-containing protein [Candidatus Yanofskybacteria bacterium]|nr:VWA domain-containing protein [Candidatus Yanofskybacteria bacterium]